MAVAAQIGHDHLVAGGQRRQQRLEDRAAGAKAVDEQQRSAAAIDIAVQC
jgi:hypothetical protein